MLGDSGVKILVFDTETTGLEDNDQLIQLAWGWWDGLGGLSGSCSIMCMPTITWESDWHNEHNLSMADIEGHPTLTISLLESFINDVESADYVLGYNVNFDLTVMERELARLGADPTFLSHKPFIDPMIIWNKSEGRKLVDAHKRWVGSDLVDAHDAEADMTGTVAIIPGMLEEFGLNHLSLDQLAELCQDKNNVDRGGKMIWVDGQPVLTCTKFANRGVFEATWSDGGQYARKYSTFKSLGYTYHKSVDDAFKLALQFRHDEAGFIAAISGKFGPPQTE
tara:strand:- start:53 stop:892 length:840 start_codon:yes stop_codon:yes gene_type:complete